jgi:hypothetical protein
MNNIENRKTFCKHDFEHYYPHLLFGFNPKTFLYSSFFVNSLNCLLYNFTAGIDWSDWRACRPRVFEVCSIEPDIFCAPPIRVNITCKPGDEERFLQVRKTLHFILFATFLLSLQCKLYTTFNYT